MVRWFLLFVVYSFFGYVLEKLFARATRSPRRVRKCFLLLPLCPVYGLAMLSVLALTSPAFPFAVLAVMGGVLCTAAEYLVHLFYDTAFRVRFWDYSGLSAHVRGRICPHFAVVWGLLSAAAVRFIHPAVELLVSAVPAAAAFALWMVFAVDCVLTARVLRRRRDTELLSLPALLGQMRASNQFRTS